MKCWMKAQHRKKLKTTADSGKWVLLWTEAKFSFFKTLFKDQIKSKKVPKKRLF